LEKFAPPGPEGLPQEGAIIRADIIGFLCTPEHNASALYIRNAIAQDPDAGNRKPEKPGCRSSEGVRWRPGLTDNQIVLPRRTRVHSANE
jgi:hypothetical protein